MKGNKINEGQRGGGGGEMNPPRGKSGILFNVCMYIYCIASVEMLKLQVFPSFINCENMDR